MSNQFEVVTDVDAFMKGFIPEEAKSTETPNTPTQVQEFFQPTNQNTAPPETSEDGKGGSDEEKKEETKPVTDKDVQDLLNKGENEQKIEDDKILIKDVSKFAHLLKEKQILDEYEDGTLPEKEEELLDALLQSSEIRTQRKVEEAWKNKVESLPDSLVRIHEYAAMGITTAQEMNAYVNSLALQEAIGELDPKNPEDQEQIVLIQLVNTGLSQAKALDEVADLKERGRLEGRAEEYFPALKQAYIAQTQQLEQEKIKTQEDLDRYIQTNGANVAYFLEKDVEYLPFKFGSNDKPYKQAIANLAATAVEVTPEGVPIFAWQKQIEDLQYGTEAEYKKYMKVMAFLANPDKYDEAVTKKGSNAATNTNFKKIKDTTGKSTNLNSNESTPVTQTKQRQQGGPWSLQ